MRRLIWAMLLLVLPAGGAQAACPATLSDCPSVNANRGTFGGELAGPATATDGTTQRMLADRFADSVNVLDYGPGGAAVDRTGATNAQPAFQAAVAKACSNGKALFIPSGTYLFNAYVFLNSASNCTNLAIWAYPHTVRLLAAATNITGIFSIAGQTGVRLYGLTLDGNYPARTSTNPLAGFNGPDNNLQIEDCEFINAAGTAVNLSSNAGTTAATNALSNMGDTSLHFASVPAGIKAGAYVIHTMVDPDVYVTSTDSTHVYLSKALSSYVGSSETVRFTNVITTTADAVYGATVLPASDTSGAAAGYTLVLPGSTCIMPDTHVASLVANTSFTLDKPLNCTVVSGSHIASSAGFTNTKILNNRFDNLGLGQFVAGSLNVVTNGVTAPGAATVTFNCLSAGCAPNIGLMVGNQTAATGMPTGMPPSDLVIAGPVPNSGASTFTVTLQTPTTASIPDATAVPFATRATAGTGYGIWSGWGPWFSTSNFRIEGNLFRHTFSSALFFQASYNMMLRRNAYQIDYRMTLNTLSAPSSCISISGGINTFIDGEVCTGATGSGAGLAHFIGLLVRNSTFTDNMNQGLVVCGGRDITIIGSRFARNGRSANLSTPTSYSDAYHLSGLFLAGSCYTSLAGTMSDVVVSGSTFSDDQPAPTQLYGIVQGYGSPQIVQNLTFSNLIFHGNASGNIAPAYPFAVNTNIYGNAAAPDLVISCTGQPTGTLWNSAGTVKVCP